MANYIKQMPSKTEQILKKCHDNLIAFGHTFLPGDFKKLPSPPVHYEIGKKMLERTTRPLAIVITRSIGKTTIVRAFLMHRILFAKKAKEWGFTDKEYSYYFGWIGQTQVKSKENVRYIAKHVEHNPLILKYFGALSGRKINNLRWGAEDLEFTNGCRIKSSSNLSSIRGETFTTIDRGALRYSAVVADDVESEDNTKTEQAREHIFRMLMDGILPAIDEKEGRLIYIGTPVHYDSFGNHMIRLKAAADRRGEDTMWDIIVRPMTNPDGTRIWPEKYTDEFVEQKKRIYLESPRGLKGFYQEYELRVISEEEQKWTNKHIQYHNYQYKYVDGKSYLYDGETEFEVNIFIGSDPATDIDRATSDYNVVLVIAVDAESNIYVLHIESHRSIPTRSLRDVDGNILDKMGIVDYLFDLYEQYHSENAKIEDVAMVRSVWQDIEKEKYRRNRFDYSFIPIEPGGQQKHNKIFYGLNGFFTSRKIFIRDDMFELERQILMLGPTVGHDDEIESLFFATRYIYPPDEEKKDNSETTIKTGIYAPSQDVDDNDWRLL